MTPIKVIAFAASTSLLVGWRLDLVTICVGGGTGAVGLFEVL